MRYGRRGRPLYPGDGGAHTTGDYYPAAACRITAAKSLHPGPTSIHPRLTFTRHQRGFSFIHPPGLPLTLCPRMERAPLGFSPSFTPRRHRQRMSRWGQAMGTRPGYVTVNRRPSNRRNHSPRAPSCRTPVLLAGPDRSDGAAIVPALSGLLSTLPSDSQVRLPSASSACCDRPKEQVSHLLTVTTRLVALEIADPQPVRSRRHEVPVDQISRPVLGGHRGWSWP